MKDTIPAVTTDRPGEKEPFANRKLIRPLLNHNNHSGPSASAERRDRPDRGPDRQNGARKSAPPEQTNAEGFYFQKQMQTKTPMVVVLTDGQEIRGCIEWYDKTCIKINRIGAPNLMIYKPSIKYMFKEGEGR